MENQIYIDNTTYVNLFDNCGFYKVLAYTGQPELLDTLAGSIQEILQEKADITTSDALYQQMKAPLTQITRVVALMRLLTFFTGTMIVSLLLCMWMRSRQKEMAVLISMGEQNYFFTGSFGSNYRISYCSGFCLWIWNSDSKLVTEPVVLLCGNRRFFGSFFTTYGCSIVIRHWRWSCGDCCFTVAIACNPCKSKRYFITNGGIIR